MLERNRRAILLVGGTSLIASFAGCSGSGSDDETGDEDVGSADDDRNDGSDDDRNGGSDDDTGDDDDDTGDDDDDVSGDVRTTDDRVTVTEHAWNEGSGAVTGRVENVSDEDLETVWVEVFFLEDLGVDIAKTEDLAAGSAWEFDVGFVGVDSTEVTGYEIDLNVAG